MTWPHSQGPLGHITLGPTYNSLLGVPGSMPLVFNSPVVLASVVAWLT